MARKTIVFFGIVSVLLAVLGMGVLAQDEAEGDGGLTEAVAANFVERFDAFFNTPDFDIADEIFAENFQSHLPLAPQLDRQGFKDYVASFYVPFPDIRQTTNKVLIAGDHLIIHVTYTGTSEGAFFGVEPTGGQWVMNGIGIFKFENGLAVENWAVIDLGELFVQTGVVVPPAPDAEASAAPGGLTEAVAADFVERFDAVFNESLDNADALFSEDFVGHLPLAPELDREGWKNYVALFQMSFPDIKQTTYVSFHSGDLLVVRVSYEGTFDGAPFFGAEPTGNPVSMTGLGIFKFVDGVPVENWAVVDVASVLAQTGAWVPPAQ